MKPIRVVLVDDHWIVRQGLRSVLNGDPAFEVVGEAADGEKARRPTHKARGRDMMSQMNTESRRVYFDHNATTYMRQEVIDSMLPYFREHFV